MAKQRFREIDIAKGIGIILVILGHSLKQTEVSTKWTRILITLIYSFHMPLFFVLSGFVAVKILDMADMKERLLYTRGRAERLLVPYFVIGLIYIPVKLKLSAYAVKPFQLSDSFRILIGQNPNTSLWFLYVLFIVSAICALFVHRGDFRSVLYGAGALCIASWWVNISVNTPKYLFFFLAGIWLRLKMEDAHKEGQKYLFEGQGILAVFVLIVFLMLNRVYFRTGVNVLRLGASICGIYLTLWFSETLVRRIPEGKFTLVLEKLGRYCMDIYILHEPVMTAAKLVFYSYLGLGPSVSTLLIFVCALLIPVPLSAVLIRRIPVLRFLLFGERKGREQTAAGSIFGGKPFMTEAQSSKKKITYITMICCIVTGVCAAFLLVRSLRPSAGKPYEKLSAEEAAEYMSYEENSLILDVRDEESFREGHLPEAVNIPYEKLVHAAGKILPDLGQTIYVYGESEEESCAAAQKLSDMGYAGIAEIGSYSECARIFTGRETEGMMAARIEE